MMRAAARTVRRAPAASPAIRAQVADHGHAPGLKNGRMNGHANGVHIDLDEPDMTDADFERY
jgi:hypothetical protein